LREGGRGRREGAGGEKKVKRMEAEISQGRPKALRSPDDAKCVRNPREGNKNKKIRKLGDKV